MNKGEDFFLGILYFYINFAQTIESVRLTSNLQEETGLCIFNMGRTLYLGGMPAGSVPSVKGTFAPVDHSE